MDGQRFTDGPGWGPRGGFVVRDDEHALESAGEVVCWCVTAFQADAIAVALNATWPRGATGGPDDDASEAIPRSVVEDALAILGGNVEAQREAFNSGATARVVNALRYALTGEGDR